MEKIFKKGDMVRAKRSHIMRLLHFPILRSEIMTVEDINEMTYAGENSPTIGVIVRSIDGDILHFSQDNLEKI